MASVDTAMTDDSSVDYRWSSVAVYFLVFVGGTGRLGADLWGRTLGSVSVVSQGVLYN